MTKDKIIAIGTFTAIMFVSIMTAHCGSAPPPRWAPADQDPPCPIDIDDAGTAVPEATSTVDVADALPYDGGACANACTQLENEGCFASYDKCLATCHTFDPYCILNRPGSCDLNACPACWMADGASGHCVDDAQCAIGQVCSAGVWEMTADPPQCASLTETMLGNCECVGAALECSP